MAATVITVATIDTRQRWNAATMIPKPIAAATTVTYGYGVVSTSGAAPPASLHPLIASSAVPTGNPDASP
ncbi:hypothetical protein [Actinomadura keratinilytica]|uniref:hypothetical protein n=1 Tax=Actinomadura keratinilytica TaxID=547461 RepID=UPI0036190BA3